jgi:hypothetical protein
MKIKTIFAGLTEMIVIAFQYIYNQNDTRFWISKYI